MIIDFSATNFRSFLDEQTISMNVEGGRSRHLTNYATIENERLAILRSAAILGANASGKSNVLMAISALRWIVVSSGGRKDGQSIPTYEPFRLSETSKKSPVVFEVEFVVSSGLRYRYYVSFLKERIIEEKLFSLSRRSRALVFERGAEDTWETLKFGGTYKGGSRRFSFFPNASYLSRAGNDASAPEFVREIYNYFRDFNYIPAGNRLMSSKALSRDSTMKAVSDLICLADTGVAKVTMEENEKAGDLRLPEGMPEDIKEAILEQNSMTAKFWVKTQSGELVSFESEDMSDGTVRLLEVLPVILKAFSRGSVLMMDEMDAHFHTDLVDLVLKLFHDEEINAKNAQLIFTTHDTNVLNSESLRRDQIWFASKLDGSSSLRSLDEYDKRLVRPDSPFETFYRDGRLGGLPRVSYAKVKNTILRALDGFKNLERNSVDA
ncbi:AAA family ATPase [Sphingomonas sp. PAMC 26605]|uniref:AAA family ATPase n=1 Tax=Sphingomonas sp. PAMC 26605 TaxID=1112214 RepID=UPI00026CC581|nr:ATP-binding protein [Sphingomonas sp. PAMC 26605]